MIDTSNKRQIAWDKYSDKFKGLGQWQAFEAGWNAAIVQPKEKNFCPRCGKRTVDLTVIHTCTPPRDTNNEA